VSFIFPITSQAQSGLNSLLPFRTQFLCDSDSRMLLCGQTTGSLARFHQSWLTCNLACLHYVRNDPIQCSHPEYVKWDHLSSVKNSNPCMPWVFFQGGFRSLRGPYWCYICIVWGTITWYVLLQPLSIDFLSMPWYTFMKAPLPTLGSLHFYLLLILCWTASDMHQYIRKFAGLLSSTECN
jgi:hypothetical protein